MDPWLCPCPAVAPRPGHLPSLGVRPLLCKMRFLFLTRLPRRRTLRSQWHTLLPFDSPAFSKFRLQSRPELCFRVSWITGGGNNINTQASFQTSWM